MLVLGLQRGPGVAQDPPALAGFYRSLLTAVAVPTFWRGRWQPCDRSGWPDINSYDILVPWSREGDHRWLIVLILSDAPATGRGRHPGRTSAAAGGG